MYSISQIKLHHVAIADNGLLAIVSFCDRKYDDREQKLQYVPIYIV